jgi:hypothetical protein
MATRTWQEETYNDDGFFIGQRQISYGVKEALTKEEIDFIIADLQEKAALYG